MPTDPLHAVHAPMLPCELRRVLVQVGAQPGDLIDAKTGKVWETNADIVKAAADAPERPSPGIAWYVADVALGPTVGLIASPYIENWIDRIVKDNPNISTEVRHKLSFDIIRFYEVVNKNRKHLVTLSAGLLVWACILHVFNNVMRHVRKGDPLLRSQFRPGVLTANMNAKTLRQKATPVDPVSVAFAALSGTVRTYAATEQCLGPLYDRRFHRLFREHASVPKWSGYTGVAPAKPKAATTYNTDAMCALRLQLLALRKPAFYGGRKLLTNHLFRPDGNPRETVAELALAVAHRWEWRDLSDVVFAKAQRALGTRRRSSSAGARAKTGTRKSSAKGKTKKRARK
jgi:hypothetical protein